MNTSLLTTNNKWLQDATNQLLSKNIKSARLDALIILEKITGLPRIQLIAKKDIIIDQNSLNKMNNALLLRLKDMPIAYIIGKSEFYGNEFEVNNDVLIPRPESESFVELVYKIEDKNLYILDLGCGSGCLGISIKKVRPDFNVTLLDISLNALKIAKINAKISSVKVDFMESSLLDKVTKNYEIIIANLPYVPEFLSNNNLSFEPRLALFGGKDGLEIYNKFWKQVFDLDNKPKYILTESLKSQHNDLKKLAINSGYHPTNTLGLVQMYKIND